MAPRRVQSNAPRENKMSFGTVKWFNDAKGFGRSFHR